jgi:hypothetical protein
MSFFSFHHAKEENTWEKRFSLDLEEITFELCFYDLYSARFYKN